MRAADKWAVALILTAVCSRNTSMQEVPIAAERWGREPAPSLDRIEVRTTFRDGRAMELSNFLTDDQLAVVACFAALAVCVLLGAVSQRVGSATRVPPSTGEPSTVRVVRGQPDSSRARAANQRRAA